MSPVGYFLAFFQQRRTDVITHFYLSASFYFKKTVARRSIRNERNISYQMHIVLSKSKNKFNIAAFSDTETQHKIALTFDQSLARDSMLTILNFCPTSNDLRKIICILIIRTLQPFY